jgi:hypothetical protein
MSMSDTTDEQEIRMSTYELAEEALKLLDEVYDRLDGTVAKTMLDGELCRIRNAIQDCADQDNYCVPAELLKDIYGILKATDLAIDSSVEGFVAAKLQAELREAAYA